VIAAAYFNKLAAERHLNFRAIARGVTPQLDTSASTLAELKTMACHSRMKDREPLRKKRSGALRVS